MIKMTRFNIHKTTMIFIKKRQQSPKRHLCYKTTLIWEHDKIYLRSTKKWCDRNKFYEKSPQEAAYLLGMPIHIYVTNPKKRHLNRNIEIIYTY